MEEAARASHIAVMDAGKVLNYGTPFSLKETYAKDKLKLIPKEDKETELGGERDTQRDKENAKWLIQMWTLAGILVVNAVTVALTVMQTMIQDEEKGSLFSFYVAPIKRTKVALGYILSAFFIGTGLTFRDILFRGG